MKIIHTADLHLDSKLDTNLTGDKIRERKAELLANFKRLSDDAANTGVTAIIIAGDLFDKKIISKKAAQLVAGQICEHADITYYYLSGNHDNKCFINYLETIPQNLKLFEDKWTGYCLNDQSKGNIYLYGIEFNNNEEHIYDELYTDVRNINIVTMHGQESQSGQDRTEVINLNKLKNKNIDYLALGHIHTFSDFKKLDARGIYCYSGCLEGRGYDECGEKGYVLLDIDEESGVITKSFVSFARRLLHEIRVDITDAVDLGQISIMIKEQLNMLDIPMSDYVKVVLTGNINPDCEIDTDMLRAQLADDYYSYKVTDESRIKVSYEEYLDEISLKGEYLRLVDADDSLSEDEKQRLIDIGLKALEGEQFINADY